MKFICVEFDVDRATAQDRPLGTSGRFLDGVFSQADIAEFATESAAESAANAAPNRRPGCSLWMSGAKRRVAA